MGSWFVWQVFSMWRTAFSEIVPYSWRSGHMRWLPPLCCRTGFLPWDMQLPHSRTAPPWGLCWCRHNAHSGGGLPCAAVKHGLKCSRVRIHLSSMHFSAVIRAHKPSTGQSNHSAQPLLATIPPYSSEGTTFPLVGSLHYFSCPHW